MNAAASPFKFLAPYESGNAGYCGREAETEELYRKVLAHRLVLVYGLSGTGKTSLIQCGLAQKLRPDVDWLQVLVRRGQRFRPATVTALAAAAGITLAADHDLLDAVRRAFRATLLPVYLIFDQFEELLLLGDADEKTEFFADLGRLLASDANVHIIISLREEYVGALTPFESQVQELFDSRVRLAPMDRDRLAAMTQAQLAAFGIGLEGGAATAGAIADKLGNGNFQLALQQVLLDQLYRQAPVAAGQRTITAAQVAGAGALTDIIRRLLTEQIASADAAAGQAVPGATVARLLLDRLLTLEGTKRPRTRAELALAGVPAAAIDAALDALVQGRLLRVVNDRFELGHDWLAAEIAELRSTEERQLAVYRRIVAEGCIKQAGDFPNAWLSWEEVTLIRPFADRLELDAAQLTYLANSHRIRRRQRVALVGGTAAVIALLSVALLQVNRARAQTASVLETSTDSAFKAAALVNGLLLEVPNTGNARVSLLNSSIGLIEKLYGGKKSAAEQDWRYADLLLQRARTYYENGDVLSARGDLNQVLASADSVLRRQPDNREWRSFRQRALIQGMDFLPLKARWRVAVALVRSDGASTNSLYNLAEKEIELGMAGSALAHLKQAERLAQVPGSPISPYDNILLQFGYGNLALLEGKLAAARNAFARAALAGDYVAADSDNINDKYYAAAAYCRLAQAEASLGHDSLSSRALNKAQALMAPLDQQPTIDILNIINDCRRAKSDKS
jgi:hypothetical protein